MDEIKKDDLEELKKKLRDYKKENIIFNEPHFTQQLKLREGNRDEVINNLLNSDKLVYSYQEKGKFGDVKHNLHFNISDTKTMRIPVILDPNNKKGLYIITYIMRYRNWRNMIK